MFVNKQKGEKVLSVFLQYCSGRRCFPVFLRDEPYNHQHFSGGTLSRILLSKKIGGRVLWFWLLYITTCESVRLGVDFDLCSQKMSFFPKLHLHQLLQNTKELKFWRYSGLPSFDYLLLLFFTKATLRSKFRVTGLPIFYQNFEQENKPYIKLADRSLLYCLKKGGQMRILLH